MQMNDFRQKRIVEENKRNALHLKIYKRYAEILEGVIKNNCADADWYLKNFWIDAVQDVLREQESKNGKY